MLLYQVLRKYLRNPTDVFYLSLNSTEWGRYQLNSLLKRSFLAAKQMLYALKSYQSALYSKEHIVFRPCQNKREKSPFLQLSMWGIFFNNLDSHWNFTDSFDNTLKRQRCSHSFHVEKVIQLTTPNCQRKGNPLSNKVV